MAYQLHKKLLYSDLTDKIIKCAYNVFNSTNDGCREKYYQDALKAEFLKNNIEFEAPYLINLPYIENFNSKRLLDFLVFKKIILEIKVGRILKRKDFQQLHEYLKVLNLQVGLLLLFSYDGIITRRVVNLY